MYYFDSSQALIGLLAGATLVAYAFPLLVNFSLAVSESKPSQVAMAIGFGVGVGLWIILGLLVVADHLTFSIATGMGQRIPANYYDHEVIIAYLISGTAGLFTFISAVASLREERLKVEKRKKSEI